MLVRIDQLRQDRFLGEIFCSVGISSLIGNGGLLTAYWIIFAGYLKRRTRKRALALAVIPTCLFLLSGLLLRHWLLAASAVLFGIGHIYVTQVNASGSDG